MARPRQPLEVIQAKGAKHLTKEEIANRKASEVTPITDNIEAPDYLTKKQKTEFNKIADQLLKLKILGETDVDALARYVVANENFIHASKQLRRTEVKNNYVIYNAWSKTQERYFKIVRACATDLGLTISSRCKLVVPQIKEDTPKENKFKQFEKAI